jgi:membrane protein
VTGAPASSPAPPAPPPLPASARGRWGKRRPAIVSLGWTLRDYAKRVWDNSSEDNVLFLASGIAFNLLLAAVPFFLLLLAGVTYLMPALYRGTFDSAVAVSTFIDRLLPTHAEGPQSPIHKMLTDLFTKRASVTVYSAIGFIWFSTRLFGSLRTVLAEVFDIENERSILAGKIFDIQITVVSTLLFVANTALNVYLSVVTSRGTHLLARFGVRRDVIGGLEYWIGRSVAFVFIVLMFYALYKYLPVRRVRWRSALVAALFTSVLFEGARSLFTLYVQTFNPASLYDVSLTAIIVIVFWTYYGALIFLLGGEVGQVYELRRVRQLQREVFT